MRGWAIGAVVLALASASSAMAEDAGDPYVGTWAFQTSPYRAQTQVSGVMSGVAVMSAGANHRYDIRMLVHEYIASAQRSVLLTARETCHGDVQDGQFSITCEMAEPLEGYQPDAFVLQPSKPDELEGVLTSASSAQVTFTRMR